MAKVKLTIDGKEVFAQIGSTILEAAKLVNIDIPTLCYLNLHDTKMENKPASCRICVVEVEGRKNLAPACATPITEGMVVKTNTLRVLEARKTVLELLLSDHPKDCLACIKAGDCELLEMAKRFGIRDMGYKDGEQSTYPIDIGLSVVRDMNKCIICRRCETMCRQVQSVSALSGVNRGFEATVAPAFGSALSETVCVNCGQCIAVCPTGALTEREEISKVIKALKNPNQKVVVQVAPAVRAALGEEFGMPAGTLVTGKLVAALKQLGFDYVFDTDFAADVTIMEEGHELLERLLAVTQGKAKEKLPILTSCCPAWVSFYETQFTNLLDYPSTVRSPQQIFGAIAKNYFVQKVGINREDLTVVSIMPCVAKKSEKARVEFGDDVDCVLTTRELARLIKAFNITFDQLKDDEFDEPLGTSSGAGVIFGATGGVMEAALRTLYVKLTGQELGKIEFTEVRGFEGLREATLPVGNFTLNVAIVHGLGEARKVMEAIQTGNMNYHAVEVMACPGGCIGGGGQPYHHGNSEIIKKRQAALYKEDEGKALRRSHENPFVNQMYKEYFRAPLSQKAHELLHTHYEGKDKI